MQLCYTRDSRNIAALKLRAVAALAQVPLEVRYRDDSSNVSEFVNTPPRGAVPMSGDGPAGAGASGVTFHTEDGIMYDTLFETNAIFRYLARLDEHKSHHLYGRTPVEASQVDMWVDFAAREIDAAQHALDRASVSQTRSSDDRPLSEATSHATNDAMTKVDRVLNALEETLLIRTYLVGERLTIADVAVAFSIHGLIHANRALKASVQRNMHSVLRHYRTVMKHPKVQPILKQEGFIM